MSLHAPQLEVTADDLVTGYVAGLHPAVALPPTALTPTAALTAALRPALERPPCVIGFSGGRDSSLLLALAVQEARRAGLPLPIAVTLEFDSEATQEGEWQQTVVDHLGLREWVRLPQGSDLDMLGPVATRGLRRHGVLYPGNAHMVVPLAQIGRGGSVITGFGGDDVLGGWPWEATAALAARRRAPDVHDLRRTWRWAQPAWLRTRRYVRDRDWTRLDWLREPHQTQAAHRIAADVAGSPRSWAARMRWLLRRRLWGVSLHAMALLAADEQARSYAPLLDPAFLSALAVAGGPLGIGDRTAVMRAVAGGSLPDAVLTRDSKAEFHEAYFGAITKRFARGWDGQSGIDFHVVDGERLRDTWLSDHPHGMSAALLQAAWLDADAGRRPSGVLEAVDGDR